MESFLSLPKDIEGIDYELINIVSKEYAEFIKSIEDINFKKIKLISNSNVEFDRLIPPYVHKCNIDICSKFAAFKKNDLNYCFFHINTV